jgi:hypothetical protein
MTTAQEAAERIARALAMEPAGFRSRYRSEPGMIGHYPWTYADHRRRRHDRPECEYEDLFTRAQLDAALTALLAERAELLARVGELEEDLRVAKSFGDLWYFVMDENPSGFEKIISEWSSSFWLDKAIDLRRAALKGQR